MLSASILLESIGDGEIVGGGVFLPLLFAALAADNLALAALVSIGRAAPELNVGTMSFTTEGVWSTGCSGSGIKCD